MPLFYMYMHQLILSIIWQGEIENTHKHIFKTIYTFNNEFLKMNLNSNVQVITLYWEQMQIHCYSEVLSIFWHPMLSLKER